EQKGVTVLDMAGLAQKGGAVLSHVQIANEPDDIHATRIATGEAALIIGCDAIVTSSTDVLSRAQKNVSFAVVNQANVPTAAIIRDATWRYPEAAIENELSASIGTHCDFIDANTLAVQLMGDAIYANPLLLGYAWQKGWVPLSHASLTRAIELNGVMVEKNLAAFEWGRAAAHLGAQAVMPPQAPARILAMPDTLDTLVERNVRWLTDYQNAAYAGRYRQAVDKIRTREAALSTTRTMQLTHAVARNLAKLMAYKDEYEVARL